MSPLPHSSGKERMLVSAGCPALPRTRDSQSRPPRGAGPVSHCHRGCYCFSGVIAFQACDEIWETASVLQQPRYKLSLRPGLCANGFISPPLCLFQRRTFPVLALDVFILCTFAEPGPGYREVPEGLSPHPGAAFTAHSPRGGASLCGTCWPLPPDPIPALCHQPGRWDLSEGHSHSLASSL